MEGFDITTHEGRLQAARQALTEATLLDELVELLSGSSRSSRQHASSTIRLIAAKKPELLVEHASEIADALNRPEAQTRWETLNTLSMLGKIGVCYEDDVLVGAEDALYDEKSGIVREAAFRFLCGYGAVCGRNSEKVWDVIDEAIRCYHGNPEFNDMLTSLVGFAEGKISLKTSDALAERMRFDSETASGTLRMRSEQIVAANEKRKK